MRHVSKRIAYSACACLALFAVLTAHGAESRQGAESGQGAELLQDPVEAVWRAQRLLFQYRSEGTMYACDVLEHKIKSILSKLGARSRIEIQTVRCRDLAGQAQFEVLMESPVVATEENVRAITHYDSEDVLIARTRGITLPSPSELERFPAVWQTITFRNSTKLSLEGRDCALVRQLRHQILPNMSVQVIKDLNRIACESASLRLTVLALVATDVKRAAVDDAGSLPVKLASQVSSD
jgi:hypothetical protein